MASLHNEDLVEDSKDVLIERLSDLISHLMQSQSIKDDTVAAMHSEVDKIESLVQKAERNQSPFLDDPFGVLSISKDLSPLHSPSRPPFSPSRPPLSPSQSLRMRMPPRSRAPKPAKSPEMALAKATQIAKEAEKLATTLSETVKELLLRKEEADVSSKSRICQQYTI